MKKVAFSGLFLFLFSCSTFFDEKVCTVGDEVLYEKDLNTIISILYPDYEEEKARELAIQQWANQQRIKFEINEKLPEASFKNSLQSKQELMTLNLFELENQYIQQNLDTTVTEDEIHEYYNTHRDNYKTQSYIVRALYIKMPDTMATILNIDSLFMLNNEEDREEIKKYANLYATNFYFEENRWIFFDDLMREVPISASEKNELILNKGKAKYSEKGEAHYINIFDYRTKSISSPLEAERDIIKRHILTRKINNLRKDAKETILKNAEKKYPITYH